LSGAFDWTGGASGSGGFTKQGLGLMTMSSLPKTYTGDTTVAAGTLVLNQSLLTSAAVIVEDGAKLELAFGCENLIKTNSLTINGTGTFDITDNHLIVDYTGSSPAAAIRQYIINGRGNTDCFSATWNGTGGINSSTAAAVGGGGIAVNVGYADNSDLLFGSYDTFGGQTVDQSSILVRYTRGADANLDGYVDGTDVDTVALFYNSPDGNAWYKGDFDYNGVVDSCDVDELALTFNSTDPFVCPAVLTAKYGAAFAAAFESGQAKAAAAAVPEPASLSLWGLGAIGLLGWRRRNQSR
jgi:autotransporter-associated beta strand protein